MLPRVMKSLLNTYALEARYVASLPDAERAAALARLHSMRFTQSLKKGDAESVARLHARRVDALVRGLVEVFDIGRRAAQARPLDTSPE